MKKGKKIFIAAGITAGCLAAVYTGFGIYFQDRFCFGTTIDGIDAGGKTVEEVEQLIAQETNTYVLTLNGREGVSEVITGESIGIAPVFSGEVEQFLEQQNGFAWLGALFFAPELELETAVTFDKTALEKEVAALSCMQSANQRKPVDASISDYGEDGYTIVSADYGTTLIKSEVVKAAEEAVFVLADEVNLEDADCYTKPKIENDNAALTAAVEQLNCYVGTTITYDFEVSKEVLDGERISQWLSVDEDFEVSIDEEEVLVFVKELAKKYNTCYTPKELKTSYGTTITISGGPYGWKINNSEERQQILEDLKEGKAIEREPVYSQRANSHGEHDYGNSYVEINLTAQHLFLYKDGKLIVESDLVSGDAAKGYTTPGGAFLLTYKTMNAVLRGPGYATPVTYWMPFNGDIGMHDLTSRKAFGGEIYKTNGSHGCINLPYSAAEKIYQNIEQGYCVLVYNMPGTESTKTNQSAAASVISSIHNIGTVTLERESVIAAARSAYNALSDSEKATVTNYQTLVDAENTLAALKNAAQTQTPQEPEQTQTPEQTPPEPEQTQTSEQTPPEPEQTQTPEQTSQESAQTQTPEQAPQESQAPTDTQTPEQPETPAEVLPEQTDTVQTE